MKTSAIILTLFCAALCFGDAAAQTTTTVNEAGTQNALPSNVFGVGLSASLCSGMGISFREHLAAVPIAYQITIGPWKTHNLTIVDVGAEFQYDLSLGANRLYAVAGGGFYYESDSTAHNIFKAPVRFGAGIGYEIAYTPSIGVFANIMITIFEPTGDILPLPSVGVLVYFK